MPSGCFALHYGDQPAGTVIERKAQAMEGHSPVVEWLETEGESKGRSCEHDPSDILKFSRAGYRARKATKDLEPGIVDVRRRLGTDDGRVGLVVSRDCEHLIREFLGYKSKDVGTGRADDHCLDSLRYAGHGLDQGSRLSTWEETANSSASILDIGGVVDDGYIG